MPKTTVKQTPSKYIVTVSERSNVQFDITCEACNSLFTYTKIIFTTQTAETTRRIYLGTEHVSDLKKRLNETVKKQHEAQIQLLKNKQSFVLLRCPNCGYIQSWMEKLAKQQMASKFAVILIIIVFILSIVIPYIIQGGFSDNIMFDWATIFIPGLALSIILAFIYAYRAVPNREYLKSHPIPTQKNTPEIRVLE